MSQFYKFTQGVEEKIRVYAPSATLFLKTPETIQTFESVSGNVQDGYWLYFTIDENNFIPAGIAQYQLFEGKQLKEYGSCQIVPSLLVDPSQDLRSRYKVIVDAIQKQLAGVASSASKRIQVGDKTIDKYSAAELLSLLDYFKGKLAEEEAGTNVNPKTDQMRILYKWTLR